MDNFNRKIVCAIFDEKVGNNITSILGKMPIWIIGSPENIGAIQSINKSLLIDLEVTTFMKINGESKVNFFSRIIYSIDEHHSEISQIEPYNELIIYGLSDNNIIDIVILKELGFLFFENLKTFFVARKRWPDQKSWEQGKTPNSIWPDGRIRK